MAKRVRGSTRPGQRARLQRSSAPRARDAEPSTPSSSLTQAEEARAAELEAAIVAAERAAEASVVAARPPVRRDDEREVRVRPGSIAVRAGEEYAYVSRDIRRIVLIGGSLIATLIGLWAISLATGARAL